MYFIDQAKITVISGNGGDGAVSFRREKYVPRGGPDGGDGGDGGDVIIQADVQMSTLRDLTNQRIYRAGHGEPGRGKKQHGARGKDVVIKVPLGTEIVNGETDEMLADVVNPQDKIILLPGGKGGRGNTRFKSSTNQVPLQFTPGKPGMRLELKLELKLIADVGFIGFPNAGKSTLLSTISSAQPKIADYPFTTLTPNIGIYRDITGLTISFADIPGIVENAHQGKGLGLEFLRHISRTRILMFVIDASGDNIMQDYHILVNEIVNYSQDLYNKSKIVVLNKIDKIDNLPEFNIDEDLVCISALYQTNIEELLEMVKNKYLEIIGKGE